jgi:hypothetical protein
MCRLWCIATSCRRNQKRGSTIPTSDGTTVRFWFGRGTCIKLQIDSQNFRELKDGWRFKFEQVRQRFRLTPTEKRVAVFVLAAFLLGLVTKCYRDAHPSPAAIESNANHGRHARIGPTSSRDTQSVFESQTSTPTPVRKRMPKPARTDEPKFSDPALEHEQE